MVRRATCCSDIVRVRAPAVGAGPDVTVAGPVSSFDAEVVVASGPGVLGAASGPGAGVASGPGPDADPESAAVGAGCATESEPEAEPDPIVDASPDPEPSWAAKTFRRGAPWTVASSTALYSRAVTPDGT